METNDFSSILLKLASPEDILLWSHGEVTKPETINYRSQRSERNGLFCERIFGPEKDFECYCGKYKKIRYKGLVCEKCGVEVTRSIVRRERMGHIALASPVSHIWFLRSVPSRIGALLDLSVADLEKVVYFSGYIITKVNEEEKNKILKEIDAEYKTKVKKLTSEDEKSNLKKSLTRAKNELNSLVQNRVLSEIDYHNLSMRFGEVFEVGNGAEAIHNLFKEINLKKLYEKTKEELERASSAQEQIKLTKKLNIVKSMLLSGVRPEWMFFTVLPVIPPALRPMVALEGGRNACSDLNDLYRRVINRNNRLKRLMEIKAPDVICRNEKRILQEAVDALIDNSARHNQQVVTSQAQRRPLKSLADMLKGKQGRFRQHLLGKRVDYSGRSAIVVGPELKMHQCGLPKYIALELFRPFVISVLLKREIAYNIRRANHLIDEKTPEVWAILEEIIKDKYVLLNRAPTLHRLGIQAFQPILVEGNAIQVHPLVCHAFNADFDGDQMPVHVPLTPEAQREAREIIAAVKNLLKPGDGEPVVNPEQDIVIGCYWMTMVKDGAAGENKYFSSPNEAITAYEFGTVDMRAKIKVLPTDSQRYAVFGGKFFETTVGRILFNSTLPNDFPYINKEVRKKDLAVIVHEIINKYGTDATPPVLDKIKKFGFEYATLSGVSWGIDDLVIPEGKKEIVKQAREQAALVQRQYEKNLLTETERYNKVIEIWLETKNQIEKIVPESMDKMGPVRLMVDSSARGTWGQVGQMTGMKGLMVNPAGKIIEYPVISNHKEGLNVLEYFITTHGARKGEVDTALKTAKAGYLTRKLVDVSQDVIINEENCGTSEGLKINRKEVESYRQKFASRIFGRVLAKDAGKFKKNHLLSRADAKELETSGVEEIYLFSPMNCQARRGICQKCYGYDLGANAMVKMGEAVGIVAAQAIGEPGTQLTMRTFHVGGVAGGGDITMGLPRVEAVFELRSPRTPAVICEEDGTISEIRSTPPTKKIIVMGGKEYEVPHGRITTVKEGDEIKKGDLLTDGPADIKNLFAIAGKERTQNYILKEIARVYSSQGVLINEKHIEIIVKQMFSRYKIKDPGDTKFYCGKNVSLAEITEGNEQIKKQEGREAKAVQQVMQINRVSLSSASFLSAASFQDTARVLITVALEGGEDKLRGLKESVITGRLIPAGTGFRKEYMSEENDTENEAEITEEN